MMGIDPGLITTGFGVIDIHKDKPRIVDAGTIKPNPKDVFPARLAKVHTCLTQIIATNKPDVVVLEKLYAHHKHPATSSILGHVRGVICLAVIQGGVTLEEHSVKRIRKALLGNGNASKEQVREFMVRQFQISKTHLALDTSDALALALGYAHMMRYSII